MVSSLLFVASGAFSLFRKGRGCQYRNCLLFNAVRKWMPVLLTVTSVTVGSICSVDTHNHDREIFIVWRKTEAVMLQSMTLTSPRSHSHSQNYVLPWIESHASVLKRPFLNKCLAWCFRGIWGISRMLQIKITGRKAIKSVLVIPKLRENGRIRMGLVCTEQRGEIACNVQDSLALVLLFHVRSVTSKSSYCFSVIKG